MLRLCIIVVASFALYCIVLAVEETRRGLYLTLLLLLSMLLLPSMVSLSRVEDKEAACSIPVVHCFAMSLPGKREGSARFVMVEDSGGQRLALEKMRR